MGILNRLQGWMQWLTSDPAGFILYLLYFAVSVLLTLTLHEIAHGYVAWKCGDPTAKMLGRLSLDPRRHLDPLGTLCLIFLGFGWAKPVPVNPRNFQNYRRDDFLVSIAGITVNLTLFLLSLALAVGFNSLLWKPEVINFYGAKELLSSDGIGYAVLLGGAGADNVDAMRYPWVQYIQRFLLMFSTMNLCVGIFNLLPIPPLDGFHILNDIVLRGRLTLNQNMFQITQVVLIALVPDRCAHGHSFLRDWRGGGRGAQSDAGHRGARLMAVSIHLKQFDGPLDLLLHLVGKAKIDLADIFVSEITEQYIEIVRGAPDFDMDEASEFIAMAALLVEIKSRRLLPKPPREEEEDPEQALIARLTAYKQFRESARNMAEFEKSALKLFGKLPEEYPLPPPTLELDGLTLEALWQALLRVQDRRPAEPREVDFRLRDIRRDSYTVEGCMETIESRLVLGSVSFDELFSDQPDREEVVTLFIALLELLKLGKAHVRQNGTFDRIMLVPGRREEETDGAE